MLMCVSGRMYSLWLTLNKFEIKNRLFSGVRTKMRLQQIMSHGMILEALTE